MPGIATAWNRRLTTCDHRIGARRGERGHAGCLFWQDRGPDREGADLVVIGSGPAGEKGAAQAAYFGKSVALIEKEPWLGGASANTGTLPSKTLRETALFLSGFRNRDLSGLKFTLKQQVNVRDFMAREQYVCDTERARIQANLERHKVRVYSGMASFVDPHTVAVKPTGSPEIQIRGEKILIATGSSPYRPPIFPFDDPRVSTRTRS